MTDEEREREISKIAEGFARSAGPALRFILTVQAALVDATPAQAQRMRKRLPPLLEKFRETGDASGFLRLIREIHGPSWRPTGTFAEQIDALEDPGEEPDA